MPILSSIPQERSRELSAIYGIGISQAIIEQEVINRNKAADWLFKGKDFSAGYDPDANKVNGVYQSNSRWNGEMSSSLIGMPVMCSLKFLGGTYSDLQGKKVTFNDVNFENIVISLTMNKDIELTKITGRDTGTVKEYIGMGDWDIELRVIVTADAPVNKNVLKRIQDGVYPRENVSEIWKVLQAPVSVPVQCWFLEQFNIRYLTIQSGVQIDQQEGQYSQQRLVIPCLSDNPLIIRTT